ncbi:anthranilate synthase component II [Antarcticirhabdus aurantiaca]|uniref:Aminodeoxychorismate/anthranilate synthase component II n=1 Tax=Antarcticirhabdus aurantiaca TaxID=2606717 RepID=A0ACD4NSE1_9HYPH|nr:aminodeoxychorismate/anthranilate synthase component II [Antarcticirhabdus aurantiaca]WAJ29591.1 aminodeoxychorismate/anthranilate synthase component II [Jeongeuplla avenae]
MILVVDNYDSFVFNVARYLARAGAEVVVRRNDALDLAAIADLAPEALVISPGPCAPAQAGISLEAVRTLSGRLPILGVCLGHQVIGEAFGGRVERAGRPMHGRASDVSHEGAGLFAGLPTPAACGRYHSLIVRPTPEMERHLAADAWSEDGEIMGLSHREHPTYGIQFHPESVLTPEGDRMLRNFLDLSEAWHERQRRLAE